MMFSALGGGTGSGLGSLILERLSTDYNKKTKVNINVFPSSNMFTSVVEPYNAVLASH
jgi:tubulin alpha